MLDHEARLFEVPCPIDVNLAFRFDQEGRPAVVNLDGDRSAIRPRALNDMLAIVNRKEWRHPDRPIIQLVTPYLFVADEPVWLTPASAVRQLHHEPVARRADRRALSDPYLAQADDVGLRVVRHDQAALA